MKKEKTMNPMAVTRRKSASQRTAEMWLESFNPIRHLTIQRAQMIFDAARRGNDVRLQWIYANIEQCDPTLMICSERRAGALVDLDFTVRMKPATRTARYDEGLAKEQATFLEAVYGEAESHGLWQAVEHLSSAFFRGHAHVAPRWSLDGLGIQGFECLDAWNVCREVSTGQWHWNPSASETLDFGTLEVIPPGELITLVRSRHVDYPAMAIYLRSALGESAWGRFLERYGVPPVIITMPPEMDPARVAEYCAAAEKVADGGTGALPHGSQVTYATEARGTNPFKEFLSHQQELVVLMATGGLFTSLTGSTGIGQGATGAHEETWRMIVRRDAGFIAAEINRTVTSALLKRAFPGKPHLASFDFETEPKPSAAEIFDLAGKAVVAGYKVEKSELEERTGYRLIEAQMEGAIAAPSTPAAGLSPARQFLNREKAGNEKALKALARSLQLDFGPIAEALQTFFDAPSQAEAQRLIERLPELLPDDPQSAVILEQAIAEAYGDAVQEEDEDVVVNGECRARDPSKCRTHGNHPGEGQREREQKTPILKDHLGKKFDPKHPEEYTAEDNIRRGKRALKKAITGKPVDVRDAMYKEGLGRIDFLLGWEGKGPALEHGKGMKKLVQKHADELESLPETIEKGRVYKIKSDKTGEFTPYACAIIHGANVAFLSKNDTGWVVTSHYETESTARKIIGYNQ